MILLDADVFVYYEKLPWTIRGMVSPNDDSTFSIILNSRCSEACQFATFLHELRHIKNNDFYNGLPINVVESPYESTKA